MLPAPEGEEPCLHSPLRPHPFHPAIQVRRRVLERECADILVKFFKSRRSM